MSENSSIKPWQSAISGGIAGITSRIIISPIDVVKIRFQLQANQKTYHHILQSMKLIIKEEGFRALWKGNLSAELLYITYGSIQFFTFNLLTSSDIFKTPLNHFWAGGITGIISTSLTYPFDLLRTRFAVQGNIKVYKNLSQSFQQIYQKEGFNGFYRGIVPSLLQIFPYMGSMFFVYNHLINVFSNYNLYLFNDRYQISNSLLAGLISGIFSKTLVMPFDTIRKRLQVQGPDRNGFCLNVPNYNGFVACWKQIIKFEGVGGFYKGLIPALIKSAPTSATMFFVVDICNRGWRKFNNNNNVQL